MVEQQYVTLTFRAFPEDGEYVGECVELGVTSCGETAGVALNAAIDATSLYLAAIEEEGERQRVFAERGIQIATSDTDGAATILVRPCDVVTRQPLPLERAIA